MLNDRHYLQDNFGVEMRVLRLGLNVSPKHQFKFKIIQSFYWQQEA